MLQDPFKNESSGDLGDHRHCGKKRCSLLHAMFGVTPCAAGGLLILLS